MADHARGERLRELRSKRGLSQEEVAHALGVTAKTYGAWERGGGIQPGNVRTVARYFKVKPGELITPEFEAEEPATTLSADDSERLDKIEKDVAEILEKLKRLVPDDETEEPENGLTEPLDGPGEGPLLSGPEGGRPNPKAAKPKAGPRRSSPRR